MHKLSVQDLALRGRRVFLRADLNVPQNSDLSVKDDSRIRAVLPTINYIISQGGKVVLASHLGRPKGRDAKYSLAPIAKSLSNLLNKTVALAPGCIGLEVKKMVTAMEDGDVLLLENLRFHPEETNPDDDPSFAAKLADLADCYVDDAFGCAHRSHASIVGITQHLNEESAAGFLLEREATLLSSFFNAPKHPFHVVCGGAKLKTKLPILNSLLDHVDAFFIGGGMVFTFLKALDIEIGDSILDEENLSNAKRFLRECEDRNITFHFPNDLVITNGEEVKTIPSKEGIPPSYRGVDIGKETLSVWEKELQAGALTFWNGPMGIFEEEPFAHGTYGIARLLSHLNSPTIVGGGDSLAAINSLELKESFTHISTGGGASLEFIQKRSLPGIEALTNR